MDATRHESVRRAQRWVGAYLAIEESTGVDQQVRHLVQDLLVVDQHRGHAVHVPSGDVEDRYVEVAPVECQEQERQRLW